MSAAREKVRTAQALRDLPEISLAFCEGRLSYTKVRALTRVAALHGEGALVRYALGATAPNAHHADADQENPSMEGVDHADGNHEESPSMEVREPRSVYRLAQKQPMVSCRA